MVSFIIRQTQGYMMFPPVIWLISPMAAQLLLFSYIYITHIAILRQSIQSSKYCSQYANVATALVQSETVSFFNVNYIMRSSDLVII